MYFMATDSCLALLSPASCLIFSISNPIFGRRRRIAQPPTDLAVASLAEKYFDALRCRVVGFDRERVGRYHLD